MLHRRGCPERKKVARYGPQSVASASGWKLRLQREICAFDNLHANSPRNLWSCHAVLLHLHEGRQANPLFPCLRCVSIPIRNRVLNELLPPPGIFLFSPAWQFNNVISDLLSLSLDLFDCFSAMQRDRAVQFDNKMALGVSTVAT